MRKKLIAGIYVTVDEDGHPTGENTKSAEKPEKKSKAPAAEPGQDAKAADDAPLTLPQALRKLNVTDDTHWTKAGDPDLTVLTELTGKRVTRKAVKAAFPKFKREAKDATPIAKSAGNGGVVGKIAAAVKRRGGK